MDAIESLHEKLINIKHRLQGYQQKNLLDINLNITIIQRLNCTVWIQDGEYAGYDLSNSIREKHYIWPYLNNCDEKLISLSEQKKQIENQLHEVGLLIARYNILHKKLIAFPNQQILNPLIKDVLSTEWGSVLTTTEPLSLLAASEHDILILQQYTYEVEFIIKKHVFQQDSLIAMQQAIDSKSWIKEGKNDKVRDLETYYQSYKDNFDNQYLYQFLTRASKGRGYSIFKAKPEKTSSMRAFCHALSEDSLAIFEHVVK